MEGIGADQWDGDEFEAIEPDGEVGVTIDKNLENKFKSLKDALAEDEARQSQSTNPRIQKAPSMFHDNKEFQKYLEPKVYSFGPIHHGKAKLRSGEKIKKKLAARFIRDYDLNEHTAYYTIEANINSFKECYDEEVVKEYTDDQLCWMFLVDGCALLFYVNCFASGGLYNLRRENLPVDSALIDVFSMENQLPYILLDVLMKASTSGKEIQNFIDVFIKKHCMALGVKKAAEKSEIEKLSPIHLLDLLWKTMRYPAGDHLELYSLSESKVRWSPSYSLKELKAVRIHLKPSTSIKLRDIAFKGKCFSGELKMRSLIVDETTAVKLSNLIAYEMCPDFKNDLEVTSYVCFLKSLVSTAEDIADLRAAQVLLSFLPSDNDVFQLLREIASNLSPNPHMYYDVKWSIQRHLNREGRTTIATWLFDAGQVYFKSPWSIIGILVAAYVMILTSLQTYFTIYPRKK